MSLPALQDLLDRLNSPYGGRLRATSSDLNWTVNSPNTCELNISGTQATLSMTKHEQHGVSIALDTRTDNFTGRTINDGSGWGTASDGTVWTPDNYDGEVSPLPLANVSGGAATQIGDQFGDGPAMFFGDALPADDAEWLVRFSFGDFVSEDEVIILTLAHRADSPLEIAQSSVNFGSDGSVFVFLNDGVDYDSHNGTNWSSQYHLDTLIPGDKYWFRVRIVSQTFRWKVWFDSDNEPDDWFDSYTTNTVVPGATLRNSFINIYNAAQGFVLGSVDRATLTSELAPETRTITDNFNRADQERWGSLSDGEHAWSGAWSPYKSRLDIVSNTGVITLVEGFSGGMPVVVNPPNPLGDSSRKILVKWKSDNNSDEHFIHLSLNNSTENDDQVYFQVQLNGEGSGAYQFATPGSTTSSSGVFDSFEGGFQINTYYWVTVSRVGSVYTAKLWADGAGEDTGFAVTFVDGTSTTEMYSGLSTFASGSLGQDTHVTFDDFSVTSVYTQLPPDIDVDRWVLDPKYKGYWGGASSYDVGDIVYNLSDGNFYTALSAHTPTVLSQDLFNRDDVTNGWGSNGDISWVPDNSPNAFSIVNHQGLVTYDSNGNSSGTDNFYNADFNTDVLDVVIKFSFDIALQPLSEAGVYENPLNYAFGFQSRLNSRDDGDTFFEIEPENDGWFDSEVEINGVGNVGYAESDSVPVFEEAQTDYYIRQRANYPYFGFKVWKASDPEPAAWVVMYQSQSFERPTGPFEYMLEAWNGVLPNQIYRFKSLTWYDGTATDPSDDSEHWSLLTTTGWDEFSSYTGDSVRVSLVQPQLPAIQFGNGATPPNQAGYYKKLIGYTDTVDTQDVTFNLYNQDGHLPVLGSNETIPNVEDWIRTNMASFYGAVGPGNLNTWSVSAVPDDLADEIALVLDIGGLN